MNLKKEAFFIYSLGKIATLISHYISCLCFRYIIERFEKKSIDSKEKKDVQANCHSLFSKSTRQW